MLLHLLLLLLTAGSPAQSLALPPLPASCTGTVNAQPLVDGSAAPVEARVPNGSKRVLRGGNLSAPLTILHLYGNTSEMNYAYGALMREEMAALVPATLAYIYAQVNSSYNLSWLPEPVRDWVVEYGVETALDWTANASLPFTPPHWLDAMAALAADLRGDVLQAKGHARCMAPDVGRQEGSQHAPGLRPRLCSSRSTFFTHPCFYLTPPGLCGA
jgi:hypothetical protein